MTVTRKDIDKTLVLQSTFTTPVRFMEMKIVWVSGDGLWFKGEIKSTVKKKGRLIKKFYTDWKVVREL